MGEEGRGSPKPSVEPTPLGCRPHMGKGVRGIPETCQVRPGVLGRDRSSSALTGTSSWAPPRGKRPSLRRPGCSATVSGLSFTRATTLSTHAVLCDFPHVPWPGRTVWPSVAGCPQHGGPRLIASERVARRPLSLPAADGCPAVGPAPFTHPIHPGARGLLCAAVTHSAVPAAGPTQPGPARAGADVAAPVYSPPTRQVPVPRVCASSVGAAVPVGARGLSARRGVAPYWLMAASSLCLWAVCVCSLKRRLSKCSARF